MERFDTNKDGKITREEYTAGRGMASFFDNFDTNKDGVLTVEEILEGMSQRKKPLPKTAESADSAE